MNEYELLNEIFKDFEVPVSLIRYFGGEKTFITYTFLGEGSITYAEDTNEHASVLVDIDIFSDKSYVNLIIKVKELLKEKGFILVHESQDMYEEDTNLYHKTLEFEIERN